MACWVPSGKTEVCGIIGYPVEHTMSPVMHNAAFRDRGLDYVYLPFRVRPEELGRAVTGMRALNIRGLNVTIPHKVAVIPFLDGLDPLAEKIGAVNTIINYDGVLTGYNTDASGFLRALLERGIEPAGKRVVILGAGGASRAVSFILAENGAEIAILNRRQELDWAVALAERITQAFGSEVPALELTEANLAGALAGAGILVNTTSVGMSPAADAMPVASGHLRPDLVVYDVIYNPIQTRLLEAAAAVGAQTIGGIDMLVWQGVMAFELWTGQRAPVALMKAEAVRLLENHEK